MSQKYDAHVKWFSFIEGTLFFLIGLTFLDKLNKFSDVKVILGVILAVIIIWKLIIAKFLPANMSWLHDGALMCTVLLFPALAMFMVTILNTFFAGILWGIACLLVLFGLLAFGEPKVHKFINRKFLPRPS